MGVAGDFGKPPAGSTPECRSGGPGFKAHAAAAEAVEKVNQDIKSVADTAAQRWGALQAKISADVDALKVGIYESMPADYGHEAIEFLAETMKGEDVPFSARVSAAKETWTGAMAGLGRQARSQTRRERASLSNHSGRRPAIAKASR
jgi:hypothetical protein